MKIVVLSGSPHKKGTSSALADAFIQGAQEAGHEIFRFDAAFQDVHPCIACERCHKTDKGCAFQDDMTTLNRNLYGYAIKAFNIKGLLGSCFDLPHHFPQSKTVSSCFREARIGLCACKYLL